MPGYGFGFSPALSHIATKLNYPSLLKDGSTAAMFRPKDDKWVTRDANGADVIWWDMISGKDGRGAEESTGVTIGFGVYEITATQTDHFYTGCAVGDIFPMIAGKTLDANNKVKRCLGNHACQPVATKRPVRGLFDGVDDIMRTAPFPLNQPAHTYSVANLKSWVKTKVLFDGNVYSASRIDQFGATAITVNQLRASAGTALGYVNIPINKNIILRTLFNGANSEIGVNGAIVPGNAEANNLGGLTIGGGAYLTNGFDFSNVEYSEFLVRTKVDTVADDRTIYNYLNGKYTINDPDTSFSNAKLVLTTDDGAITNYTDIFPLLVGNGITATFYIVSDYVGTAGYMTWAQILEMHNAGMDMQCHTKNHAVLTTLSKVDVISNLQAVNTAFIANGLPAPTQLAYPFGGYSSITVQAQYDGLRATGRTTKEVTIRKNTHKYELGSFLIDGMDETKFNTLKGHLDDLVISKEAMTLFTHGMSSGSAYGYITAEYLNGIIDYAQSKGIDIITISQLSALMNNA